jgi:NAD(P)-dependent dehydrogenase (short-subunit alcohol dehydrogenase family)
MFQPGLLAGKKILVTGGGTGLGAAMGQRFAELGAELVICGRRQAVLEETAGRIRERTGGAVTPVQCDIRDPERVEAMMDAIWRSGPLAVLVNNAAGTFVAKTEHLSHRAVDAVLSTTLNGAVYCTISAGRRWISAHAKGTVLSILSPYTITGKAFTVPSAIAKSGVLAMTRSLAVEWGPKGIRLVGIGPGLFPTPAVRERLLLSDRDKGGGPEARVPLGRLGDHAELANLASYLVSDQAGYITGEMVVIDGGSHLRTSGVEDLLLWTDEQWEELGHKRK